MTYRLSIERGDATLPEMMPLYTQHYAEMKARLERDGIEVSPFNPRVAAYVDRWRGGGLLHYTVRTDDGQAVGYSNVYLTNDMHNQDLIAQEDTIYITPEHRNGVGKKLVRFVLDDLKSRGVRRVHITAMTDLRVAKIWQRMGFVPAATAMIYTFPR